MAKRKRVLFANHALITMQVTKKEWRMIMQRRQKETDRLINFYKNRP